MGLRLTLDYASKTPQNTWRYRRKVPLDLRAALGKREFVKVIGKTEAEAVRNYQRFHDQVEAEISEARRPDKTSPVSAAAASPLEEFRAALTRLKALGIDLNETRYREEGDFNAADALLEVFEVHDAVDSVAHGLLTGSGKVTPPAPTFGDAVKLYVTDKIVGSINEKPKRLRVDRVAGHVRAALGKDMALKDFTRQDARQVVEEMLSTLGSAATVHRYVNDIKAIINYGITEFGLAGTANHFVKVPIKGHKAEGTKDRDERHPFTRQQLMDTRAFVLGHAREDLRLIWRLLEGTGCRVSEIAGLRVEDVKTGEALPYLDIRFNDLRRLKNTASIRRVPLVADALKAATAALAGRTTSSGELHPGPLFDRYGKERGGDAASAALMKSVRKVVSDKRVTVHSLRHSMQDRMIKAGISDHDRKLILGHASGGEGGRYGSDAARLEATTKAMKSILWATT